jgi:hypothetical protein
MLPIYYGRVARIALPEEHRIVVDSIERYHGEGSFLRERIISLLWRI